MKNRVCFRPFEERDVNFVYKVKQNMKIQKDVVKDIRNFSYQDAVEWVHGCMATDQRYRFWAICSNDEFQNIVGWCGISSIDPINKKACARGITIANPAYNDGIAWYETYVFLLDYVFDTLKFNRFYTVTFTSNIQTMIFNEELFLNTREGLMKQSVFKDGEYHDVAIHAILKDEYINLRSKGLSVEIFVDRFRELLRSGISYLSSIECFLTEVKKRLTITNPSTINGDTVFRDLAEWSSLFALEIYFILENGFATHIDIFSLNECKTLEDLYRLALTCSQKTNEKIITVDFEDDINDINGF